MGENAAAGLAFSSVCTRTRLICSRPHIKSQTQLHIHEECVGCVNRCSPGNRGSASPRGGQKVTSSFFVCTRLHIGLRLCNKVALQDSPPNNLCPHVTFTPLGRKLAAPSLNLIKTHNLGWLHVVELALLHYLAPVMSVF